mmetsp:Transcript_10728/g.14600  ORF Transcript_10728/g.14600 Transcript_10728/m.14600 type:complete len:311 (-) Transcript_10728:215-1147(-)
MIRCSSQLRNAEVLLQNLQIPKAMKIFHDVIKECNNAPNIKVYQACVAAMRRKVLPIPDVLPVPRPDSQSLCRALMGLGQAQTLHMESLVSLENRGHGKTTPEEEQILQNSLRNFKTTADKAWQTFKEALDLASSRILLELASRVQVAMAQHVVQRVQCRIQIQSKHLKSPPICEPEKDEYLSMIDQGTSLAKTVMESARGDVGQQVKDEARIALEQLAIVKQRLNEGISSEEVRMVMTAIGLGNSGGWSGEGHWFTCPNGHPYVIGECGGAMQESRCPECGATIGGHNHALNSSNRTATEFHQLAQNHQ